MSTNTMNDSRLELSDAQHDFSLKDGYTHADVSRSYRMLIRQYHPDLAKTPKDKAVRVAKTSRINNEYRMLLQALNTPASNISNEAKNSNGSYHAPSANNEHPADKTQKMPFIHIDDDKPSDGTAQSSASGTSKTGNPSGKKKRARKNGSKNGKGNANPAQNAAAVRNSNKQNNRNDNKQADSADGSKKSEYPKHVAISRTGYEIRYRTELLYRFIKTHDRWAYDEKVMKVVAWIIGIIMILGSIQLFAAQDTLDTVLAIPLLVVGLLEIYVKGIALMACVILTGLTHIAFFALQIGILACDGVAFIFDLFFTAKVKKVKAEMDRQQQAVQG